MLERVAPSPLEPVVAAEIDFLAGRFREWTGRGSPPLRARAAAAAGDEAEIWMNTDKLHLFDPATGENLTVDREHAGRLEERALTTV